MLVFKKKTFVFLANFMSFTISIKKGKTKIFLIFFICDMIRNICDAVIRILKK